MKSNTLMFFILSCMIHSSLGFSFDILNPHESKTVLNKRQATGSGSCTGEQEFQCKSGQCIDAYTLCDKNYDCDDASDESQLVCGNIKCPAHAFKCTNGACIELSRKCDGKKDCPDGFDESPSICGTRSTTTMEKSLRTRISRSVILR